MANRGRVCAACSFTRVSFPSLSLVKVTKGSSRFVRAEVRVRMASTEMLAGAVMVFGRRGFPVQDIADNGARGSSGAGVVLGLGEKVSEGVRSVLDVDSGADDQDG